jgi:hypothetical protein
MNNTHVANHKPYPTLYIYMDTINFSFKVPVSALVPCNKDLLSPQIQFKLTSGVCAQWTQ